MPKAATFWMASFMCKEDQIVPGSAGINTAAGNKDSTATVFGLAKLNAGDIVSTGFLHNQGEPWDKIYLYSSLVMLRIGS